MTTTEEPTAKVPVSRLEAWKKMLQDARNPSVQFDRDNNVMLDRAFEARSGVIERLLEAIEIELNDSIPF